MARTADRQRTLSDDTQPTLGAIAGGFLAGQLGTPKRVTETNRHYRPSDRSGVAELPPSRRLYDSMAMRRNSAEHRSGMYITDARHFLDDKGAVAPVRGPAKAMADFHAGVIAYATDCDASGVTLPRCFKCKKGTVEAALAQDDAIVWHCPRCGAEGRISNWQATLWDLSARPDAAN